VICYALATYCTCHQDFNPKAERARLAAARGSGGVATTRVKSKGPSGARASAAWQPARPVAPAARPAGGNRAAAAVKAAHRAAQNAAQRVHPHMAPPQRAGGGHMSAVVPTHRLVPCCLYAFQADCINWAWLGFYIAGHASCCTLFFSVCKDVCPLLPAEAMRSRHYCAARSVQASVLL
jgi:hypothetical protein